MAAALALAGCSDGDSSLQAAEAKVSAKERSLAKAEDEATVAAAELCASSATYITALDRYGDVLNQTAVTVGDVSQAGSDLGAPRDDVSAAADAVQEANAALIAAQKELTSAQADLARAQASASGTTLSPSDSPTPSPTQIVEAATVTRVQEAEAELATAQVGISDGTPLRQASQQFNAAVVALEMAWLQLFADADCGPDDQQGQAVAELRNGTAALQQALADAGYYSGAIDGVYGPSTVSSVEQLQQAHGLPVTGTVDKATHAALQGDLAAKGGAANQAALAFTASVQQTLKLAGFWNGPVDGQWTPALTEALAAFQTELGVPATGVVDAATIAALQHAIAVSQNLTTSPTPSASASSSPSESASTDSPSTSP